jgi:fatty-acyl-CoA synthase
VDSGTGPSFQRMNRKRLLGEDLTRNTINFGDRAAICDIARGFTLTFAGLERRVNWVAHGLLERLDVKPGDRIGVLGRNEIDTLTLYYAASRIGAVIVPLNYRGNSEEHRYILDDCTASVLVVSTEILEKIGDAVGAGCRIVTFGDPQGCDELAGFVGEGDCSPPEIEVDDLAPAYIMYTGGTTGAPKGVTQCQAGYVALAQNMLLSLAPQRIRRTDSWLMCAPLYHGGGWAYSVTTLHFGMCLYLLREFDAEAVTRAFGAGQGTVTWFVPTMSRRVIDYAQAENVPKHAFDGLRLVVSAGAPLDRVLRREMMQWFRNAKILDMVGQTEVTSTVLALSEDRDIEGKPNSVGLPVPGMAVAILDDDNRPLQPGEIGEICYRGNQLMLGYWNKPDATAAAMAGGWFHSGDLGRRDEDGIISMVGRKKEVIKSGGETIIPNEIEEILHEVDGVKEACVVGLDDRDWGERVHAVIADGGTGVRAALLAAAKAHCRARLSSYKVPKTWTVVERLPTSAVGKVDKAAVRRMAESEAAEN